MHINGIRVDEDTYALGKLLGQDVSKCYCELQEREFINLLGNKQIQRMAKWSPFCWWHSEPGSHHGPSN